jgi:hypothetical protein
VPGNELLIDCKEMEIADSDERAPTPTSKAIDHNTGSGCDDSDEDDFDVG